MQNKDSCSILKEFFDIANIDYKEEYEKWGKTLTSYLPGGIMVTYWFNTDGSYRDVFTYLDLEEMNMNNGDKDGTL